MKFLLITANCVYEIKDDIPDDYKILVGQFDSDMTEYTTAKVQVEQIFVHPEYVFGKFENNIAVIMLEEEVSNS